MDRRRRDLLTDGCDGLYNHRNYQELGAIIRVPLFSIQQSDGLFRHRANAGLKISQPSELPHIELHEGEFPLQPPITSTTYPGT